MARRFLLAALTAAALSAGAAAEPSPEGNLVQPVLTEALGGAKR